jgi:hypothetical protein
LVDFKKLLGKQALPKSVDPIEIFGFLEKDSGKENLRSVQASVLKEWHTQYRNQRDVVVKLHTGQGKTLLGMLMLQSSLNEGLGPAIYLCPNNYLVNQTVKDAKTFGIKTVQFPTAPGQLLSGAGKPPTAFLNSAAILVTNCKKLFNGKSVFGVAGSMSLIGLGAIVVDDAHKCLDIIRESFSIRVDRFDKGKKPNIIYKQLWDLFEESLRRQAAGTCSDILNGKDSVMAVPYWTWHEKRKLVLEILQEHKVSEDLLFVWDLLKDHLDRSTCVFSGKELEISPRLLPLDLIPSFDQAKRRIFLSATLTEDAFLVKDLGIKADSATHPLSQGDSKYSGERLILMPTLVDTNLRRDRVISWITGLAKRHGEFGVVAITPSRLHAESWKNQGADVTDVKNLEAAILDLRGKISRDEAKHVIVLVNQYDGVDLPDALCRILCVDSLSSYTSLVDRYHQEVRPGSTVLRRQRAQRVEQGMGRGIRSSSDWCAVIVTGNNLTDFLSEDSKRGFLSTEAQAQIKIGEELAKQMVIEGGGQVAIDALVKQCLDRDEGWKEYYKVKMNELEADRPRKEYLDRATSEREAEILFRQGLNHKAVDVLESLVQSADSSDKGWYLQLKATYLYPSDTTSSIDAQIKAYSENQRLFRPETGVGYSKLNVGGISQPSQIIDWMKSFQSHSAIVVHLMSTFDNLTPQSSSEEFEGAIDELGKAIGLPTQRPEKTTGAGPDNLWQLNDKTYMILTCKNEVDPKRRHISKTEGGQMANDIGWFKSNYPESTSINVFIHPAHMWAKDAFIADPCLVLDFQALEKLKDNTLKFYGSLKDTPFDKLTRDLVKDRVIEHHISSEDLVKPYLKRVGKN